MESELTDPVSDAEFRERIVVDLDPRGEFHDDIGH